MYGADIEFLLYDPSKKKVVPAFGKVGGTKDEPIALDENYSYLEDNACVEFNYTPRANSNDFAAIVLESVSAVSKLTGLRPHDRPEARIAGLSKFAQADEFGCVPDYWAYADDPEAEREMPNALTLGKYRCAGGHIHISYDNKDEVPRWVVARFMDKYVTIPTMHYAASYVSNAYAKRLLGENRRKWYGLPGLYRPKEYGLEYRTLSNAYAFNEDLCYYTFGCVRRVSEEILADIEHMNELYLETDWGEIKNCIENLDLKAVAEITNNLRY